MFQPLQGPYRRVIDIKFQYVCSTQCKPLSCQGARRKDKKGEKFTLRNISMKKCWQPISNFLDIERLRKLYNYILDINLNIELQFIYHVFRYTHMQQFPLSPGKPPHVPTLYRGLQK